MSAPLDNHRCYWLLQVTCWSLYGSVGLATNGLFGTVDGRVVTLAYAGAGFLLLSTHLLRKHAKRKGWTRLAFRKLIPRLLIATLLIAVVSQLFVSALMVWGLDMLTAERSYSFKVLALYILQTQVILLLWALLYFSLQYFRNYKSEEVEKWKLQAAVKDSELATLKAQINPHFIFNCLNNIRALVLENPEKAREMITRLSELLRYSVRFDAVETVTIERELEIVRDYLALEAIQMEERLRYRFEVDPATLSHEIPPMAIQLIVENAIKHGLGELPSGGEIVVRSEMNGEQVVIEVLNTGHIKQWPESKPGIGVQNARQRLALLFGETATLALRSADARTVSAKLRIPIRKVTVSQ